MPFREVLQQLLTVMAILGTVTFIVQLGGGNISMETFIYIYNYIYICWLVVWNIFYFPFHIWDHILPTDEVFIFLRWLKR